MILAHVRDQFALSRQTYGSLCMHVELYEVGIRVGHHRTARVIRVNGLNACHKSSCKRTTDSNHGALVAANVRSQYFRCDRPDQQSARISVLSGTGRAGCIWRWLLICILTGVPAVMHEIGCRRRLLSVPCTKP